MGESQGPSDLDERVTNRGTVEMSDADLTLVEVFADAVPCTSLPDLLIG